MKIKHSDKQKDTMTKILYFIKKSHTHMKDKKSFAIKVNFFKKQCCTEKLQMFQNDDDEI